MAPVDSANTDGIHIAETAGLKVWNSIISIGDDCLLFGLGTKDVEIWKVQCGPGHGISIGSLGKTPGEKDVEGFFVRNLTFSRISMHNVNNPIIIDQEYRPSANCDPQGSSRIQIRNVKFINIWGTLSSKVAVNLRCSESKSCQEIELQDINLSHQGNDGPTVSQCSNVKGVSYGQEQPPSCI